jgi:hypothetical protein
MTYLLYPQINLKPDFVRIYHFEADNSTAIVVSSQSSLIDGKRDHFDENAAWLKGGSAIF